MAGKHAAKILTAALTIAFVSCEGRGETARGPSDTAFATMQARGQAVMGVDQYASAHVFEDVADGGRIVLDRHAAELDREDVHRLYDELALGPGTAS